MFRAVPFACALAVGGCSAVFVDGPPRPPARGSCTRSAGAPIVDTSLGVLSALGAIYFATSGRDDAVIATAVETALAAGFGTSAYVGFRRVGRCRALPEPAPGGAR